MTKKELKTLAKDHAANVWGVYVDDVHPDTAITETLGEMSQKDFLAGFESAKDNNQELHVAIMLARKANSVSGGFLFTRDEIVELIYSKQDEQQSDYR